MEAFDAATLTHFAQSLLDRAKVSSDTLPPSRESAYPKGRSTEELHAAIVSQHDMLEAMSSRFAAEFSIAMATMERMEREIAVLRGCIDQLLDYDRTRRIDVQKAIQDSKDVAESCIDRFTQLLQLRSSSAS